MNGKIIVTLTSKELEFDYSNLGITFDSTNQEIIDAVAGVILEQEGINIKEDSGEGIYIVKKVQESGNCYLFPKAVAG